MSKGVSIVICCYNSSKLLPDTLKFISGQSAPADIPFEVIVIDNNSTDDTSETAENFLSNLKPAVPYKILVQKIQGLSSARKMGFDNSDYEYIIFCDDDNRLASDYVEMSYNIMEQNEKIGALGGDSTAVTDGKFTDWFEKFQQSYSVGKQAEKSGNKTWDNSALWGAGMVVRKSALNELFSNGYRSLLSDRKKNTLTSGGDIELCYALRLAGWEIWYDSSLKLKHFIPRQRLNWKYLRKLNRGFGAQKADLDPYLKAFEEVSDKSVPEQSQQWLHQSLLLMKKLRGYGFRKLLKFNSASEGDPEILRIEKTLGRLSELLKIRGEYDKRINSVRNAAWRKVLLIEHSKLKSSDES
ncbi:MAG: glycosyltransferase family 2 protein [Ignavibacteria bacterium]|nr:glycosyltransferase family 2 protein [Ignavibacteria bacterium]